MKAINALDNCGLRVSVHQSAQSKGPAIDLNNDNYLLGMPCRQTLVRNRVSIIKGKMSLRVVQIYKHIDAVGMCRAER